MAVCNNFYASPSNSNNPREIWTRRQILSCVNNSLVLNNVQKQTITDMIKEFIELWNTHKADLQEVIAKTPMESLSYKDLVKLTIDNIINKGSIELKTERLTEIDDGDYQGSQLYIVPVDTYRPSADDYYFTENYYGSCSGCDTLKAITNYEYGLPNEEQVKELVGLCLNLIQQFKKLKPEL